jgi:hypothetical protein
MRVLIVVPAYNEERALPDVLGELRAAVAQNKLDAEVAVIDDGSSDGTAGAAQAQGVRVFRLRRNLGIGGAVQCGLRIALREDFDGAIQIDGDGQHPASELSKLLQAAAASPAPDLIVGTRYLTPDGFRSTVMRRLGGWWLTKLLAIFGLRVSDPTSGFRFYGRRALTLFNQNYPYDYPEPESLAMAEAAGLVIAEVPVMMRARQGGRSSIARLEAPYYMVKVTLAVILAYLRNRRRPSGGG